MVHHSPLVNLQATKRSAGGVRPAAAAAAADRNDTKSKQVKGRQTCGIAEETCIIRSSSSSLQGFLYFFVSVETSTQHSVVVVLCSSLFEAGGGVWSTDFGFNSRPDSVEASWAGYIFEKKKRILSVYCFFCCCGSSLAQVKSVGVSVVVFFIFFSSSSYDPQSLSPKLSPPGGLS